MPKLFWNHSHIAHFYKITRTGSVRSLKNINSIYFNDFAATETAQVSIR